MKTISVYITPENEGKLKKIIDSLNNSDDVKNGTVTPWKYSDIYTMLINDAIENYKIK